jgi:Zn-dependent protease with chaperone function
MGRVSPEDFDPLVASSLIYFRKYRRSRSLSVLSRVLLPILVLMSGLLILLLSLRGYSQGWSRFGGFILLSFLVVFLVISQYGIASNSRYLSEMWLRADREAAALIGRENFEGVLKRIDGLGLEDMERLKHRGRYARLFVLSPRPDLSERIRNIESLGVRN